MLKRTLFFSNPYYLSVKDKQLIAKPKDEGESRTVPVEDIGFVVIDNMQISLTMGLIEELNNNNVAIVFCDSRHHPNSMLLNLDSHNVQNELFRHQIAATEPLKKNLWKQSIEAKIRNQASLLKKLGLEFEDLQNYSNNVKTNDSSNREAVAARIYWQRIFGNRFKRDRYGDAPNSMLNYGYIVLRAAVARSLVGSGLLPTLGIHHHNKYNAFCLADDIMEPFRPYLDDIVIDLFMANPDYTDLTKEIKAELLKIMTVDTLYSKTKRPLMIGLSQTTASLARCFSREAKKIEYPEF